MEKSLIIIGGGLAGLSAGCYGRMNGYRTSIFEMNDKTGGVCTSWKRRGYTIDGGMLWLMGTKPGTPCFDYWEELGAAQKWKVVNHDRWDVVEDYSGNVFHMYSDIDRLEREMMELAPEDEAIIREYTQAIRYVMRFNLSEDKPLELYGITDYLKMFKMLPLLRFIQKWGKITTADYYRNIKNPLLRNAINIDTTGEFGDEPMFGVFLVFAFLHQRAAGYVIGGNQALNSYIQQRYLELGGELHLKSKVEKILLENDKAVGIRLADDTEHRGDIVISAADGHATIFDMLDGMYINNKIRSYYDDLPLYPPLVYIGLGVARKFDDVPSSAEGLNFPLDKPVVIAGKEHRSLSVQIYNFDPTLAPEGKTMIRVLFHTDYDYWERLYEEPDRYKAEKELIADTVVALLDERFPGLEAQVEVCDVATPMTWVRYTGNWRGAYEGWKRNIKTPRQMSKTLPGLDNFYMAGQWVRPGGGMPAAVTSGRHTIQIICNKDKKKFVTSKP